MNYEMFQRYVNSIFDMVCSAYIASISSHLLTYSFDNSPVLEIESPLMDAIFPTSLH